MRTRKPALYPNIRYVILGIVLFTNTALTQPAFQEHKADLAVLPLRTLQNAVTLETQELTEWIVFKIFSTTGKKILDQKEVERILSSGRSIDLDSCFSDDCNYDAGSLLGVEKVVWGTIESSENKTVILLSLGDVAGRKKDATVMKGVLGPLSNAYKHLPDILSQLFNYSPAPAGDTVPPTVEEPEFASIELTSEPSGAQVTINGEVTGITPCKADSLDSGTYEIALDLNRYKPFSKKLFIPEGVKKKYLIKLVEKYGYLTVLTHPSQASFTLNGKPAGKTPFSCDTMGPGHYKLSFTYPEYVPCTTSVTIYRGKTDTVKVKLTSQAYVDSLNRIKKRKHQVIRRIVFGTLAAGFTAIGMYYNGEVETSLKEEEEAYNNYNQDNLSASDYEKYMDVYRDAVVKTDNLSVKRNTFYIIGGVFGISLGFSIFF